MGLTKRFVYLLVVGVIIVGVGSLVFNPVFLFISYNLLCGALLALDYYISPATLPLKVEFCGPTKLSLYEEESLSFRLFNSSEYQLEFLLRDEVPDYYFQTEDELITCQLDARGEETVSYSLTATKRGSFTFSNLYIKFKGRLGLCTKSFKVELEREIKVYPSRKNIAKYRLMMINDQFQKQGRRNIRRLGRGNSFESLREYVSGDEYKKINWKATARLNKPIVNQYQPEKNQHVYIFIDTGRPMSYQLKGKRKLDLAINTAVALADIVNQKGDQVAALSFNTAVENIVLPGKGAGHRNKILDALYDIEATTDTSNYQEAFQQFKKNERHHSIIFLFTDFATEEEARNILKLLPQISKNNIVVVVLLENEKLEQAARTEANSDYQLYTKGVALELLTERQKIIKLLNRHGVFCIESPPEELDYQTINKYIEIKNKLNF